MTPESLSQMLSDFLAGAHAAIVVEDAVVAFDLADSKYSISGEYNKCLLHLWSSDRNVVRRVLDAEIKGTSSGCKSSGWARIVQPSSISSAIAIGALLQPARRRESLYSARMQRALERHFP